MDILLTFSCLTSSIIMKSTSILLLALILLQSCVFYQKVPISLNDAQDQGKAKAVSKLGKTLLFKNIIVEDSLYYGVTKTFNMQLDSTVTIYLKNVEKSRAVNVIGFLIVSGLLIGTIYLYNKPFSD